MKLPALLALAIVALTAGSSIANAQEAEARQLFYLANQARQAAGAPPLQWDDALASAALAHCQRMAKEVRLDHSYDGEPNLTERTSQAGAHFSLVEENIAVGSQIASIHKGWMDSDNHRGNMLNPKVDHVGIAVVSSNGSIFAVADFARAAAVSKPEEVEARVGHLVHERGLAIHRDPSDARKACAMEKGSPAWADPHPSYVLRWQGGDLSHLPQEATDKIDSKQYREATIGSCPAIGAEGQFTVYRVAILFY